MPSLTKIHNLEREKKSIFDKASDEFNLMMVIITEREFIKKI